MSPVHRCAYCRRPSTHVVKWPRRSVLDINGNNILAVLRSYVCVEHCRKVLDYQNRVLGRRRPVRGYRYRR